MLKFKQGKLTNMDGVTEDIVVSAPLPNKVRDLLIGSGLIISGVAYIAVTAFKYGSAQHEEAELDTMTKLGII